jgi:hypothetical protein
MSGTSRNVAGRKTLSTPFEFSARNLFVVILIRIYAVRGHFGRNRFAPPENPNPFSVFC